MNTYVNPPCKVISLLPRHSLQIMSECEEEVGTRSPLVGVSPVMTENWQLMRVFPRAALSRICILSPIQCGHPRRRGVHVESVGGDRSKRQSN